MTVEQLTLGGGAVPMAQAAQPPRLTQHQRAVLAVLARQPTITIAAAGVAIHNVDEEPCMGITGLPEQQKSPCCEDNRNRAYEVCKQLASRGILVSVGRSVWKLAER